MTVLDCGCCEDLKRGYHRAILWLVAGAALYNSLAWLRRREPHLLLMAALNGAAAAGECYVCRQHRSER